MQLNIKQKNPLDFFLQNHGPTKTLVKKEREGPRTMDFRLLSIYENELILFAVANSLLKFINLLIWNTEIT